MEQLIGNPVRIFSLVHELDDLPEPYLLSERLRRGTVEISLILVYQIILSLLNGRHILLPSANHLTTGFFFVFFVFFFSFFYSMPPEGRSQPSGTTVT